VRDPIAPVWADAGRIEQVGSPTEIYEQPASDFVMGFVGPVSRIGDQLVRPHDVTLSVSPNNGAVQARVRRVVHLGFEVRIELELEGGEPARAQLTRAQTDELELKESDIENIQRSQAGAREPSLCRTVEEETKGAQCALGLSRCKVERRLKAVEFAECMRNVIDGLKPYFGTLEDPLLLTGSGTGALEAAIVNTLSPGDEVLAVTIGLFGDRFADIAEAFGANVRRLAGEWGTSIESTVVQQALHAMPAPAAILLTHNETSTGVMNDIHSVGDAIGGRALYLVDGVSSVGGVAIETDAWGIDVLVSGSQKAWMVPPGVVMVSVSQKAWEAKQRAPLRGPSWDFTPAKSYFERGFDIQPTIAVTSTSQTSETWELPISQLTLTCAVFEAASAINIAPNATAAIAYPFRRARSALRLKCWADVSVPLLDAAASRARAVFGTVSSGGSLAPRALVALAVGSGIVPGAVEGTGAPRVAERIVRTSSSCCEGIFWVLSVMLSTIA